MNTFDIVKEVCSRPAPFEKCTISDLWNNPHISKKMLEAHLDKTNDVASRNKVFFNKAVKWITDKFKVETGTSVCDFGCGPGFYAHRFASKGAYVTGLDIAEKSIEYARDKANSDKLNIDCRICNYLEFISKREYDLAIMIQHDYCALSPLQRSELIKIFHKTLKLGGYLLIDVYSYKFFEMAAEKFSIENPMETKNYWSDFWSEDEHFVLSKTFKYDKEMLILDKYAIIEKKSTKWIYNWLQCFDRDSFLNEFKDKGFELCSFYSDITGADFSDDNIEFAAILKKN